MRKCLLVVLAFLLAGCSLTPIQQPVVASYTLKNLQATDYRQRVLTTTTLLVSKPQASPGYSTNKMQYMKTAYRLQPFSQHRWVATPAEMFLRVLSESVQNLGYFKAVVTPPFSGLTDYDLETTILEFEQNFMRPQSRFIFVLQADLVNSKTNRIVASKRFKSVVPAKMNNAFGGVLAANQAAAEVAQQVARFARNYARAR